MSFPVSSTPPLASSEVGSRAPNPQRSGMGINNVTNTTESMAATPNSTPPTVEDFNISLILAGYKLSQNNRHRDLSDDEKKGYLQAVVELLKKGVTNVSTAKFFSLSRVTINKWIKEELSPDDIDSIKKSKLKKNTTESKAREEILLNQLKVKLDTKDELAIHVQESIANAVAILDNENKGKLAINTDIEFGSDTEDELTIHVQESIANAVAILDNENKGKLAINTDIDFGSDTEDELTIHVQESIANAVAILDNENKGKLAINTDIEFGSDTEEELAIAPEEDLAAMQINRARTPSLLFAISDQKIL